MTSPREHAAYDVVIVGGGPAGLAAAWQLRDQRIVLLEAEDRLGGRLKSLPRNEYWINLGGHLFPGAGSNMQRMLHQLGLETMPIPGSRFALSFNGKVYGNRRVETYPFTLPLSFLERAALIRVGLRLRRGIAGLRTIQKPLPGESEPMRRARASRYLTDITFREFIGSPPERVDAIFRSAGRRASAELEQQSAANGVSLFGAVWANGANALALNLKGGSGRFGDAMERALASTAIRSARVTEVRPDGECVAVTYEKDGEQSVVRARQVIMAVPAAVARRVVADIPPDVAKVLDEVTSGPFLSMGILTSETGPMPWDSIYAITTPDESFDMVFNHANPLRTSGSRKPGGSFMVYSGGDPARRLMELDDDHITQTYLADLLKLFPQLAGHIAETVVQRWPIGNVYRSVGIKFEPMWRYCERDDAVIHYAGDYFGEIGTMEVAATTAVDAAKRAIAGLRRGSMRPTARADEAAG